MDLDIHRISHYLLKNFKTAEQYRKTELSLWYRISIVFSPWDLPMHAFPLSIFRGDSEVRRDYLFDASWNYHISVYGAYLHGLKFVAEEVW